MIALHEAESVLSHLPDGASPSELLTALTYAGAFKRPDEQAVRTALLAEGVPATYASYTLRVLRKLGVLA